jgi:hypothetical protein
MEQRVANYIAQNRAANRPNPEQLTPRQQRRVNQKLGTAINRTVKRVNALSEALSNSQGMTVEQWEKETGHIVAETTLPPVDVTKTETYWSDHTVKELRAEAKERGHKGYSSMKKDDLIKLLIGE